MKILSAICLIASLSGSFAQAADCNWKNAQGITVEDLFLGNDKAAIEVSGPGDYIETYNYTYTLTNRIVGIAGTEDVYGGKNFSMMCNSTLKTCNIHAVTPSWSKLTPNNNVSISGVTCN